MLPPPKLPAAWQQPQHAEVVATCSRAQKNLAGPAAPSWTWESHPQLSWDSRSHMPPQSQMPIQGCAPASEGSTLLLPPRFPFLTCQGLSSQERTPGDSPQEGHCGEMAVWAGSRCQSCSLKGLARAASALTECGPCAQEGWSQHRLPLQGCHKLGFKLLVVRNQRSWWHSHHRSRRAADLPGDSWPPGSGQAGLTLPLL